MVWGPEFWNQHGSHLWTFPESGLTDLLLPVWAYLREQLGLSLNLGWLHCNPEGALPALKHRFLPFQRKAAVTNRKTSTDCTGSDSPPPVGLQPRPSGARRGWMLCVWTMAVPGPGQGHPPWLAMESESAPVGLLEVPKERTGTGGLRQQERVHSRFWGWKTKLSVLAELIPSTGWEGEAGPCLFFIFCWLLTSLVLLDLYKHHPDLCLYPSSRFFMCAHLCVYISLLYKGLSQWSHLNLNICKDPVAK